jgi:hypothetical protein
MTESQIDGDDSIAECYITVGSGRHLLAFAESDEQKRGSRTQAVNHHVLQAGASMPPSKSGMT